MKIKMVVTKEETQEKEISLPYFCKYDKDQFIKVIGEKEGMVHIRHGITKGFFYYPTTSVFSTELSTGEEITEHEFNEAYHSVLLFIGKYVPAPEVPKELLTETHY